MQGLGNLAHIHPHPAEVAKAPGDAGRVRLGDRSFDARGLSPQEAREAGLRFVHQQSAVFLDKNAGIGKTISVTGISITGADIGNYSFNTTATATATISRRALLVTAHGSPYWFSG